MLMHVLVAVKPENDRDRIMRLLGHREVMLRVASGSGEFLGQVSGMEFDVLVMDGDLLPERPSELIGAVRELPERPEVVVLTGREDAEERASLLTAGCLAVLNRCLSDRALEEALHALIERRREEACNRLRADRPEEHYSLKDFVSDSPTMQIFLELAQKIVRADSSLLLTGETGVGKERLARAIHAEGPRSRGPFMAVNCGALPESLLESELFGHEEGAFTGAIRARKGYFELAHRGTIFLDEVGEIPLHLQVKLLRVLAERQIQRVGGGKPIAVDVRVMAATNRDVEAEVRARRFREDLFYRLAVVTLEIPPLRERREDIPKLVESYLQHFSNQTGRPVRGARREATEALMLYDWPGNVRELVNVVERAVLLAAGPEIGPADLPGRIVGRDDGGSSPGPSLNWRFGAVPVGLFKKPLIEAKKEIISAFERRYLEELLRSTGGRIGETAERARLNERSLYAMMKKRGLKKEDYRHRSSRRTRRGRRVDA